MTRFSRGLAVAAGLAAATLLGASRAQAAPLLTVTITDAGGSATFLSTDSTGVVDGGFELVTPAPVGPGVTIQLAGVHVGNFIISGTYTSNAPGTTASGVDLANNSQVTNTGATTGSVTIATTSTGYTLPSTSTATLTSGISHTFDTGASTINFSSQVTTPGGTVLASATNTQLTATGGNSTSVNVPPPALSGGYTLKNTDVVANVLAGGQSDANGATSVFPAVAVPEPATVVMALGALPLLGIGAWVRRRRAQV